MNIQTLILILHMLRFRYHSRCRGRDPQFIKFRVFQKRRKRHRVQKRANDHHQLLLSFVFYHFETLIITCRWTLNRFHHFMVKRLSFLDIRRWFFHTHSLHTRLVESRKLDNNVNQLSSNVNHIDSRSIRKLRYQRLGKPLIDVRTRVQ